MFAEKWLKMLLNTLFVIAIGGGIAAVQANSYAEYSDLSITPKEVTPSSTVPTTWQECQANCQAEPLCQTFVFSANYGTPTCFRYENTLAYGPLHDDDAITGQLDSKLPTASLAWLGIGKLKWNQLTGLFRLLPLNISRAECEAQCNGAAKYGAECAACIAYKTAFNDICNAYSAVFNEVPSEPSNAFIHDVRVGIRSDLNFSETAITGDTLDTRVSAADLPPAPPDIGAAIPAYVEIPFNFELGAEALAPYNEGIESAPTVASWQECSVLCHQDMACKAFNFNHHYLYQNQCNLFDVVILGQLRPGYDTYGIIDRSGPEGAVSSLAEGTVYGVRAGLHDTPTYKLFTYTSITSMDDCAKLCYDFYQPKACGGFFFSDPMSECQLFDASVPCGFNGSASLDIGFGEWDAAKFRFGFIEGRLPHNVLEGISCCYGAPFTNTVPCGATSTTSERRVGDVQIFWNKPGKIAHSVAPMEILLKKRSGQCAVACHARPWCVSFDYNEESQECRLFEVSVGANNLMGNSSTQYSISGGVYHSADGN